MVRQKLAHLRFAELQIVVDGAVEVEAEPGNIISNRWHQDAPHRIIPRSIIWIKEPGLYREIGIQSSYERCVGFNGSPVTTNLGEITAWPLLEENDVTSRRDREVGDEPGLDGCRIDDHADVPIAWYLEGLDHMHIRIELSVYTILQMHKFAEKASFLFKLTQRWIVNKFLDGSRREEFVVIDRDVEDFDFARIPLVVEIGEHPSGVLTNWCES